MLNPAYQPAEDMLDSAGFRAGIAELGKRGLSFDAWFLEPQLPELIDLARQFPDIPIVLDHVGGPLGYAGYAGRHDEVEAAHTALAGRFGARRVRISVFPQRETLIAWYRRLGYAPTGETLPFPSGDPRFGLPLRDDLHFIVLERPLA